MKTYSSIEDIEREFFPTLYEARIKEKRMAETPDETAARLWAITKEALMKGLKGV